MTSSTPLLPPSAASLGPYVNAGIFNATEVRLAEAVARLGGFTPGDPAHDHVLLALAVAARGPRSGHVCIELDGVGDRLVDAAESTATAVDWPDTDVWAAHLAGSALVATPDAAAASPLRPLVWDGARIYLQRYWAAETIVYERLVARAARAHPVDTDLLDAAIQTVFADPSDGTLDVTDDRQAQAVRRAMTHTVSVIVGGPGTGKTWTVARLLLVAQQVAQATSRPLSVALVAPTGKAAGRMSDAVQQLVGADLFPAATTIHRLLDSQGHRGFRHGEDNPLPQDLIVVDETSMVDLPLMAHLMVSLRPTTQLVLVGDASQLASVEAGTVLRDVVGPFEDALPSGDPGQEGSGAPLSGNITILQTKRRFAADAPVAVLADAIKGGREDEAIALLAAGHSGLAWVDPSDTTALAAIEQDAIQGAVAVATTARAGDASGALDAALRVKVLAATRLGPLGLDDWSGRIQRGVLGVIPDLLSGGDHFIGRPLMVTANDRINHVFNGDVGVIVDGSAGPEVAIAMGSDVRTLPIARLSQVETWWAMTIHKSQGSEFAHVIVSLPNRSSPILTRELLYTAVTRGKPAVTVIATEEVLREAIHRPVSRASGLRDRLWKAASPD